MRWKFLKRPFSGNQLCQEKSAYKHFFIFWCTATLVLHALKKRQRYTCTRIWMERCWFQQCLCYSKLSKWYRSPDKNCANRKPYGKQNHTSSNDAAIGAWVSQILRWYEWSLTWYFFRFFNINLAHHPSLLFAKWLKIR